RPGPRVLQDEPDHLGDPGPGPVAGRAPVLAYDDVAQHGPGRARRPGRFARLAHVGPPRSGALARSMEPYGYPGRRPANRRRSRRAGRAGARVSRVPGQLAARDDW